MKYQLYQISVFSRKSNSETGVRHGPGYFKIAEPDLLENEAVLTVLCLTCPYGTLRIDVSVSVNARNPDRSEPHGDVLPADIATGVYTCCHGGLRVHPGLPGWVPGHAGVGVPGCARVVPARVSTIW